MCEIGRHTCTYITSSTLTTSAKISAGSFLASLSRILFITVLSGQSWSSFVCCDIRSCRGHMYMHEYTVYVEAVRCVYLFTFELFSFSHELCKKSGSLEIMSECLPLRQLLRENLTFLFGQILYNKCTHTHTHTHTHTLMTTNMHVCTHTLSPTLFFSGSLMQRKEEREGGEVREGGR